MIKIVYDRKDTHGFLPNLTTESKISDRLRGWTDPGPPYSSDFRFRDYLALEKIPYEEVQTKYYNGDGGIYPIHLDHFDLSIDYFALMRPESLELVREGRLTVVFYYSDGKDPAVDILPRIDYLSDLHNLSRKCIRFICTNAMCERYENFIYLSDEQLYTRYMTTPYQLVEQVNLKPRKKKLTYVNHYDRPWTRLMAASMWYHGFHVDSYFVYGKPNPGKDFDTSPIWKWHTTWEKPKRIAELFGIHLPLKAEPIQEGESEKRLYTDSYWSLVSGDYLNKQDFCLGEDVFKPIANMQPFVYMGPPGALALLKNQGYRTFGNFIDESYDSIQNDEKRLYKCFQLAFYLYNLPHEDHQSLMRLIEPTLIHNQEVLLSSKKHMLLRTLDKIR